MRRILSTFLAVSALACLAEGRKPIRSVRNMAQTYKLHDAEGARKHHLEQGSIAEYTFDVEINHFTTNGTQDKYKMRYLIDESYVKEGDQNPPILFYCGNEGDVWTFYNNSGFMTTYLPQ